MSDVGNTGGQGPATDRANEPVIDPTANVLDLVQAAVKRLDDLMSASNKRLDDLRAAEMIRLHDIQQITHAHSQEMARYRERCDREKDDLNRELRNAETNRIDAIRAVDVGAVSRAAEVSAAQATTLAAQVAASAEALRGQVAAAANASNIALAAAIEPIQKSIDDLRKTQYEQAGQKAQQTETRGGAQWAIGFALSAALAVITIVGFIIYVLAQSGGAKP